MLFDLFAASVDSIREAAHTGDVAAQYKLGRMCESGRRVPRNDVEAAMWYRRAADRGHAEAQYRLGLLYAAGRGVSQDVEKAKRRLRDAADQGVSAAKRRLLRLEKGAGQQEAPRPLPEKGKRPPRGALIVFILTVALIQFGVAVFHFHKDKPRKERHTSTRTERRAPATAAAHYLRLAERGDVEAGFRVARMYDRGSGGLPQDDKQAVAWYRKGAARGHAHSMHCLGWMYEHGRGVPKDMDQALEWYRRAAAKGFEGSQSRLRELEERRRLWETGPAAETRRNIP